MGKWTTQTKSSVSFSTCNEKNIGRALVCKTEIKSTKGDKQCNDSPGSIQDTECLQQTKGATTYRKLTRARTHTATKQGNIWESSPKTKETYRTALQTCSTRVIAIKVESKRNPWKKKKKEHLVFAYTTRWKIRKDSQKDDKTVRGSQEKVVG